MHVFQTFWVSLILCDYFIVFYIMRLHLFDSMFSSSILMGFFFFGYYSFKALQVATLIGAIKILCLFFLFTK